MRMFKQLETKEGQEVERYFMTNKLEGTGSKARKEEKTDKEKKAEE